MKSFRNVLGIVFLGLILVGVASAVKSQEAAKETTREETTEQVRLRDRERILENESKILEKYAERFAVDTETLADLRAERMGYGEISHALVFSEMADISLEEIVAMRDGGKGWGQIAEELGVRFGKVRRETKREYRRIRRELTREERRTLRHSWKERRRRAKEVGSPQLKYKQGKLGKEYGPPKRGHGRGGGGRGGR